MWDCPMKSIWKYLFSVSLPTLNLINLCHLYCSDEWKKWHILKSAFFFVLVMMNTFYMFNYILFLGIFLLMTLIPLSIGVFICILMIFKNVYIKLILHLFYRYVSELLFFTLICLQYFLTDVNFTFLYSQIISVFFLLMMF